MTRVNLVCTCGHSDGHNCHADWSKSKYLQPSAPGRHTVDTITDPALHRLYDDRDMYARDWDSARQRAEQAEAERDKACRAFNAKVIQLENLRAELDRISALPTVDKTETRASRFSVGAAWAVRQVRNVLDPPKPVRADLGPQEPGQPEPGPPCSDDPTCDGTCHKPA